MTGSQGSNRRAPAVHAAKLCLYDWRLFVTTTKALADVLEVSPQAAHKAAGRRIERAPDDRWDVFAVMHAWRRRTRHVHRPPFAQPWWLELEDDWMRLGDHRKAWKKAREAAGLHGTLVHDLRRSAARNAVRSGVSPQVAQDLGGWKTPSVFARYNVTSERDLGEALQRVSAYVAERSAETPTVQPLRAAESGLRL